MTSKGDRNSATPDDSSEIYESFRLMNCICPVCKETTEVDMSQITSNNHETDCTACGAPLTVVRISNSRKGHITGSRVNCACCGNPLATLDSCESCGAVFPDLFDTIKSKRKKPNHSGESEKKFSPAIIALALLLLLSTISIAVFNYFGAREQYIDTYFRMLNVLATGIDANIRISSLKAAGKISQKDDAAAGTVKSVASRIEKEVNNPPAGLSAPKEKLLLLQKLYMESNSLVQYPPASHRELQETQELYKKRKDETMKEIKNSLPSSFITALPNARMKYRELKDF